VKQAIRTVNVFILDLPDGMEEDDLEFVVDISKIEVTASVKQVDGTYLSVPESRIDIDVEEEVIFRDQ
jgi:hypothetical protein